MAVPIAEDPPDAVEPVGLAILGSTGSIGCQTLDVVNEHPDRFRVVALAAGANAGLLAQQAVQFRPELVVLDDGHDSGVEMPVPCLQGEAGLIEAATHPDVDIVVTATSGHTAIVPTARAIEAGKSIALANKETIVCAGGLITALAREHGVEIRPVDSEHSAIWQSLGRSTGSDIERLILTASGGPFRELSIEAMRNVTLAQAMAHPTWAMGGKITIDSATMMNKGLELIEAHWLFGVDYNRIDIVVHPESVVHSLIEFVDGSQVAQLGLPDMRLPIQYALTYPRHVNRSGERLSLSRAGALRFFEPDPIRFPALRLAREAGMAGDTYPTVLSAADEVAVKAFHGGRIRFVQIAEVVERCLLEHVPWPLTSFDAVAEADEWGRLAAERIVAGAS
ncbi:MAG: 1-deoxy-D-xylulose-5-phosphate reductoisomerase [Thermomicrobiales bacterium]|nr:1-deoxy-D-xylulose-5-phosphate reductoisomerase [Thermomicrobiales bacterium]